MIYLTKFSFEFSYGLSFFTEDVSLVLRYHYAKESINDQKLKSMGSCLNNEPISLERSLKDGN